MSEMYRRQVDSGPSGVIVRWQPSDDDAAAQALADVSGAPPATKSEAADNAAVDFSEIGPPADQAAVAREVRERYAEIVEGSA